MLTQSPSITNGGTASPSVLRLASCLCRMSGGDVSLKQRIAVDFGHNLGTVTILESGRPAYSLTITETTRIDRPSPKVLLLESAMRPPLVMPPAPRSVTHSSGKAAARPNVSPSAEFRLPSPEVGDQDDAHFRSARGSSHASSEDAVRESQTPEPGLSSPTASAFQNQPLRSRSYHSQQQQSQQVDNVIANATATAGQFGSRLGSPSRDDVLGVVMEFDNASDAHIAADNAKKSATAAPIVRRAQELQAAARLFLETHRATEMFNSEAATAAVPEGRETPVNPADLFRGPVPGGARSSNNISDGVPAAKAMVREQHRVVPAHEDHHVSAHPQQTPMLQRIERPRARMSEQPREDQRQQPRRSSLVVDDDDEDDNDSVMSPAMPEHLAPSATVGLTTTTPVRRHHLGEDDDNGGIADPLATRPILRALLSPDQRLKSTLKSAHRVLDRVAAHRRAQNAPPPR